MAENSHLSRERRWKLDEIPHLLLTIHSSSVKKGRIAYLPLPCLCLVSYAGLSVCAAYPLGGSEVSLMAQAVLLDSLKFNWKDRIMSEDIFLEDLLAEVLKTE